MELLELRDISFQEHGVVVLHPLSFIQPKARRVALVGESGAGKSTVLQIIAGLVQASTGEIIVEGSRVRGPAVALVPGHPGVAYLSQKSDLPKFLRVEQVLQYASRRPAAEAHTLYKVCRIDHLLARRTDQLSGGEQQRVALARLLLGGPRLLLLDEPFSNLDRMHKQVLQRIIEELGTRLGITCWLVSHDAADVLSWADEVLVLQRGRLVQRGTPEQVYHQPVDVYTAGLFGDYNLLYGADQLALTPGTPVVGGLLVRPEQFLLVPPDAANLQGSVRAIRFFGSYYELEVQLSSAVIRVRSSEAAFVPGELVGVRLATSRSWVINNPA
jgi:ABC-type Fe3+/spermidine/putrescine transport system ATPase subunit